MISLLVGTSVLISRSTAASWMFGATVGGSLFKSSLKCSTQRISCSHSDVSKVLFLSSFGNQFYTVPCSLCMAASSARDARFSMYFRLSALARSFTSFFAALYISWYLSLSRGDFESMTFLFNLLLLSVAFQVSGYIHSFGFKCL